MTTASGGERLTSIPIRSATVFADAARCGMVREAFRPGDVAMGMEPCDVGPVDECPGGSAQAWYSTAAQMARNAEYYRGLLVRIGEMLGVEAYTADDGSISDSVLCAKLPELLAYRLKQAPQRHHPNGIEPPDEERDRRAQRRAAERNLMDFYDNLGTYISACDAMKPSTAPDYTEAGETFARLIKG